MGEDRLVPPQQHWMIGEPAESCPMKTHGAAEMIAMSGVSRLPSFGTPGPDCQAGLLKIWLAPPPLSAHPLSIPPGATPTTLVSFPEPSYCGLNWVPPTPVTCGLAAISLAFCVVPITQLFDPALYCRPAAPQSPE